MTSRIQYRQAFNRVIGYALKPDKRPELIASTLAAMDTEGMISEMEALGNKSCRCEQPVAHFVLSVKEGERLSDGQWNDVANRIADAFGMEQFFAVRHNDTGCDHLHLIGNRVRANGKTWSTSNDRLRIRSLCQELEDDFNITATPFHSNRCRINKDELEKAERLRKEGKQFTAVPARLRLAQDVKASLAQSRSADDFEEQLQTKGITTRWRYDPHGRPVGVSFSRGEAAISGRNAGASCRIIIGHLNKGAHEQNRYYPNPGGDTRLDSTIGPRDRFAIEGGFAAASPGHGRAGQPDASDDRSAIGDGRGYSATAALLNEAIQMGSQLMISALDRIVREAEADAPDRKHRHPDLHDGHFTQTFRRILRTPKKQLKERHIR